MYVLTERRPPAIVARSPTALNRSLYPPGRAYRPVDCCSEFAGARVRATAAASAWGEPASELFRKHQHLK